MSELPDNSIDVVFTSPPYNLNSKATPKKLHSVVYDTFFDDLPLDRYMENQIQVLNCLTKKLKQHGSIFYNHKPRGHCGTQIDPHSWVLKSEANLYQTIIWDRGSTHNHELTRLWPQYEYIFHLSKPGYKPFVNKESAKLSNIWRVGWYKNRIIKHPAVCPLDIVLRCIQLTGISEGVVLDPYMGSGTTAVAALELGFDYVGFEISQAYINIANDRIKDANLITRFD